MLNEKNSTAEAFIQDKGRDFLPKLKQVRIESTKQDFRKRISSCFEALSLIDPLPSRFSFHYAENPNNYEKKRRIGGFIVLLCIPFWGSFCLVGIGNCIYQSFLDKPNYNISYILFGLTALINLPLILSIIVGKTAGIIAKCLYTGVGSNKDNVNANNIQDINDNQELRGYPLSSVPLDHIV